jgi:multisubunit Na+/H+ antiporter MnhC subunit
MRTFWFTLAADIVNGGVRVVLLLLLGKEGAENAFRPVMKALILLSTVIVIGLVISVFYLVLCN